jgi:hypothetical protein
LGFFFLVCFFFFFTVWPRYSPDGHVPGVKTPGYCQPAADAAKKVAPISIPQNPL